EYFLLKDGPLVSYCIGVLSMKKKRQSTIPFLAVYTRVFVLRNNYKNGVVVRPCSRLFNKPLPYFFLALTNTTFFLCDNIIDYHSFHEKSIADRLESGLFI